MATYAIPFRVFTDKRTLPVQVADYFVVPNGTGTFKVRVVEVPANVAGSILVRQVDATTHIHNPATHKTFAIINAGTPDSNQVLVDSTTYITGEMGLAFSGNVGLTIEFSYLGKGATLFAQDLNELSDGTLIRDGKILSRHLNISSLVLSGNLTVAGAFKITGTGVNALLSLGRLVADPTPSVSNLGAIYYSVPDKQFKGIAEGDTPGTYKVVIIG